MTRWAGSLGFASWRGQWSSSGGGTFLSYYSIITHMCVWSPQTSWSSQREKSVKLVGYSLTVRCVPGLDERLLFPPSTASSIPPSLRKMNAGSTAWPLPTVLRISSSRSRIDRRRSTSDFDVFSWMLAKQSSVTRTMDLRRQNSDNWIATSNWSHV